MSYIDILPQTARTSARWATIQRALVDDNRYASCSNGWSTAPQLFLYNFDTTSLPKNIILQGIQVLISAKVSGSTSTAKLGVRLAANINGDEANYSTRLYTGVLSTSETALTVGSSSSVNGFDYNFRYWQIADSNFGVEIIPYADSTVNYYIDTVVVRVYYTTSSYLAGNRSQFSFDYDAPVDILSKVSNGYGLDRQVKSEELNTLGDCIYNIEMALINGNSIETLPLIGSRVGVGRVYAATMTVTGTIAAASSTPISYYVSHVLSPTLNLYTPTNLASGTVKSTSVPRIDENVNFYFMSGIGWVEPTVGSIYGLYVSPTVMNVSKNSLGNMDYTFGFTAVPKSITTSTTDTDVNGYLGVRIDTWAAAPSVGTLYVKLFGLGIAGV